MVVVIVVKVKIIIIIVVIIIVVAIIIIIIIRGALGFLDPAILGRGGDAVGSPRRAQIVQFELFELKFLNSVFFEIVLLVTLDTQFPIEQFEPAVSQSTVSSHPPKVLLTWILDCVDSYTHAYTYIYIYNV